MDSQKLENTDIYINFTLTNSSISIQDIVVDVYYVENESKNAYSLSEQTGGVMISDSWDVINNIFLSYKTVNFQKEKLVEKNYLSIIRQQLKAKATDDPQKKDKISQDFISIGGPCVNPLAAKVMELPFPSCGHESKIPENKAIIKSYDYFGRRAFLIAGWGAEDTKRAVEYIVSNPINFYLFEEVIV